MARTIILGWQANFLAISSQGVRFWLSRESDFSKISYPYFDTTMAWLNELFDDFLGKIVDAHVDF